MWLKRRSLQIHQRIGKTCRGNSKPCGNIPRSRKNNLAEFDWNSGGNNSHGALLDELAARISHRNFLLNYFPECTYRLLKREGAASLCFPLATYNRKIFDEDNN